MMVTFSRIVRYGWQNFLRNVSLSFSTISIMILAAAVFEGLILFNVVGKQAISSIQEKIDISVYFKSNVPEDTILGIKRTLENVSEVKEVAYVSSEEALKNFKERHAGEESIVRTLDELEANPLSGSLNIKAKDPRQYETIAKYLEGDSIKNSVEKVDYAQNQIVIERLIGLIDTLKNSGISLTLFLAFLAVVVAFNTIRLAIYSNRDQIGIMRVVGASNMFIRGPYILEGILYGAIAALISFCAMIPVIHFLSPYVINFIPEMDLSLYFRDALLSLFGYQLLFCGGLAILSSIIAVRKYLHA